MKIKDRTAKHRRMAQSYGDSYARKAVKEGASYEEWKFADDAVYISPYFTGGEVMDLGAFVKSQSVSIAAFATMEAKAYSVKFPDWGPVEFKYWTSDTGFAMRTLFEGHTKDGTKMSFYSVGFVETNDEGEIKVWETFVNGDEFSPFLEAAIGVRGPFRGPTEYFEALGQYLMKIGH